MKLCAGVVTVPELAALIKAGADEFFCGFLPREWRDLFGQSISSNRREALGSNVTSYSVLNEIVTEAHRFNKKVYVNLNAHYYPQESYPVLEKIIRQCLEYKADGIIVADIGLLQRLKDLAIEINVILSGEYGARNTYDIKFVRDNFKISRVILPRHMSIKDISRIVHRFPEYEFEVFVAMVRCPFDGANCFPVHACPPLNRIQKFCDDFNEAPKRFNVLHDRFLRYFTKANYVLHAYYNRSIAYELVKRQHIDGKVNAFTCGLCAIAELKRCGVSALKIVTRGENLSESEAVVKIVKMIDEKNYNAVEIKRLYSDIVSCYFNDMCDSKYMCYYP